MGLMSFTDYQNETYLHEKREMRPDYGFDSLIRKAASAAGEIDKEIRKGGEESDRIDKEREKKNKATRPEKDEERPEKDEERPDKLKPGEESEAKPGQKPKKPTLTQDRPILGRNRKPDRKSDLSQRNRRKGAVANAEELTEEQAWLRLLDTSFDRSS